MEQELTTLALCEAHEELTSEQKQEELLPISVQQVYVLNLLGEHEEAQSISTDISIDKYDINCICEG